MPHQTHNPNNYGRALMSAIPQAITPIPHTNLLNYIYRLQIKLGFNPKKKIINFLQFTNLLNVLVQIVNKLE
jgi:hypothetical protein